MHIYIDESGDLAPGQGTRYFVIGMVCCDSCDLDDLKSIIRTHNERLWKSSWPRRVEIKASHLYSYKKVLAQQEQEALSVSPREELQSIILDINKLPIKAGFIIHNPANQGPAFRILHKEKIYNYLSKQLYNKCLALLDADLDICVDQRNFILVKKQRHVRLKEQRLNLSYMGYIENELGFQFAHQRKIRANIRIEFDNSKRIKGLQVADYLCWAIRKEYEGKPFWANLLSPIAVIKVRDNF